MKYLHYFYDMIAGELRAQAAVIYEAAEAQSGIVPEIQTLTEMRQVSKLWQAADALEGKLARRRSKQLFNILNIL